LSELEGVDGFDGCGEEDRVVAVAGGVTEGGGEVTFAEDDDADEDGIGTVWRNWRVKRSWTSSLLIFWPVPTEGTDGFDDGKAGGLDASGDGPVGMSSDFALDELGEVIEVGEGFLGGGGGGGTAVFLAEREAEETRWVSGMA